MAKKSKRKWVWYSHDHADSYLLAAAHHLARAARNPLTEPLPAPSISATLFCAFAAEAYVNVALIRVLGEEEYASLSKVPVRSKYFLASRLGAREEWFSRGVRRGWGRRAHAVPMHERWDRTG